MTAETLTSIRELDTRVTDGARVRLLWCEHDGTLWVTVVNTKTGDAFHVEVHQGEQPADVFHHPYAYAAHHGVETSGIVDLDSEMTLAA